MTYAGAVGAVLGVGAGVGLLLFDLSGSAVGLLLVVGLAGTSMALSAGIDYASPPLTAVGWVLLLAYVVGTLNMGGEPDEGSCARLRVGAFGETVDVGAVGVMVTAVDRAPTAPQSPDGRQRLLVSLEIRNANRRDAMFRPADVRLETCVDNPTDVLSSFRHHAPSDAAGVLQVGAGLREETTLLFEVPAGFPEGGYAYVAFAEATDRWVRNDDRVRWNATCPDGVACTGWRVRNREAPPVEEGTAGCAVPATGTGLGAVVTVGDLDMVVTGVRDAPTAGAIVVTLRVTNVGDRPYRFDGQGVRVAVCAPDVSGGGHWRFRRYGPSGGTASAMLNPDLSDVTELRFRLPDDRPHPGWVYIELGGWRTGPVLWESTPRL